MFTQNFGDLAHRQGSAPRRRNDLGDHHLPMPRLAQRIFGNQDVVLRTRRIGNDISHALIHMQPADHAAAGALQHLDHRALGAAALVNPHRAHQHPVTVHQLAHLPRRQEQVIAAGIGQQKPTIRLPTHR